MNAFKKIIVASVAALAVCTSCKKSFLELVPYNQVSLEQAINNESDLQAALNGAYAKMRDVDLFGKTIPLIGDLMADNVYIALQNSNRFLAEFNYSYLNTHGNASTTWADAYNAILRLNNVINSSLSSANSNQLKGEALTMRALMYFYLVNIYAKPYTVDPAAEGVPLVLTYDPLLKPGRSKVSEVYSRIDQDLTDAFTLMTNTSKNSSYVTKYVARALQARVALFKGDWNAAKTAALDVVNNGGYTLTSAANYVNYWKSPTPVTNKVETIFEITNDAINNGGFEALSYFYDRVGYGDAIATDQLYNLYAATDVRRDLMESAVKAGQPVKYVKKYPNTSNASEKDDVKIIRYAEVLLILSEAYARTNDETNARARLNQVAQARDASFTGYTSTGAALINDILLERRKELAFEGHRYFDLTRLNMDVVRVNLNGNYPANTPLLLATTNFRRIWTIPQSERDVNPAISQNPGY